MEARRQFSTVEEFTLLRLNRTQRSTRGTTDGALAERNTSKRTVLLGLGAIRSERVRQNTGGRSGVSTRSVVYRLGHGTLANEANERGVGSVAESESGTHCDEVVKVKTEIRIIREAN